MDIQLLGTSGCHLCDIAERLIRRIAPNLGFGLEKLDIALDDSLMEQYAMSIPVARFKQGPELNWPFDEEQLINWLNSIK